MNKITKLLIAVLVLFALTIPYFNLSAYEADDAVSENWNFRAVTFSTHGADHKPITWQEGDKVTTKTVNTYYRAGENGSIKLIAPNGEDAGYFPVTGITSKYKTELADLSVDIKLDEFSFIRYSNPPAANKICILWSEDEPVEDRTMGTAATVCSNGMRYYINYNNEIQKMLPAHEVSENERRGKALYLELTGYVADYEFIASKLNIVYYDGAYVGSDNHPGYRWTFGARNIYGANGDAGGILKNPEYIDLTDGLHVLIKEDEELGFIVNINGRDFCRGEDVGYFPEAYAAGKPNEYHGFGSLGAEDYYNKTEKYLNSMEYARDDIDLTGLKDAGKGYLTVGTVGVDDKTVTGPYANITVERINNKSALTWKGEPACYHNDLEWKIIEEPNCGYEGTEGLVCKECGKVKDKRRVDKVGEHIPLDEWVTTVEADCVNEGERARFCKVCELPVIKEKTGLAPDNHKIAKKSTPPTCIEDGYRDTYCKKCGIVFEDKREIIPKTGEHEYGEWVVIEEADYGIEGKKARYCIHCEDPEYAPVEAKKFPDVPEGEWYYEGVYHCVAKKLMVGNDKGEFLPDENLTREQFVVILARVAGAELDGYKAGRFSDVKNGAWYAGAVAWAAEEGYVKGIGNGEKFGVGRAISRQELAVMLSRYAEAAGMDVGAKKGFAGYIDAAKVAVWAKNEVAWAVDAGLIGSVEPNKLKLAPEMTVTRAQAAKIFMVFAELG